MKKKSTFYLLIAMLAIGFIGKRIQEIRKKCGLTQERLAEKLSVSVGYISQLERGITRANLDTLSNISSELDCDITYFLTDVTINDKNFLNDELAKIFKTKLQKI